MTPSRLSFRQLWNMNIGCFGIQFSWSLQMANVSAIFESLGANPEQLPLLWLAAPMTGLLVQPVIGYLSDHTWGPLGRRRPYFVVGALLTILALVTMPNAQGLGVAVGLLWLMDSSVNISMEPFRAFVGDLLPEGQRTQGFAMQSIFVGLGAVTAAAMPWVLNHTWITAPERVATIPLTVKLSFYVGAVVLLVTILWTVITTSEHPPKDLAAFEERQSQAGPWAGVKELAIALKDMPMTMRELALVQFFTWLGMFCFFLYFPTAVAWNVFGATDEGSVVYRDGIEWAGLCLAAYNLVCLGFAFALPFLARRWGQHTTHAICLFCGGVSLMALGWIRDPFLLFLPMVGFGIAWSSILAMPYSILMGVLPRQKLGLYTGIFNFFIVLPQVVVSLGFGWLMAHWLGGDRMAAVVVGGGAMVVAGGLMQVVRRDYARELPQPGQASS